MHTSLTTHLPRIHTTRIFTTTAKQEVGRGNKWTRGRCRGLKSVEQLCKQERTTITKQHFKAFPFQWFGSWAHLDVFHSILWLFCFFFSLITWKIHVIHFPVCLAYSSELHSSSSPPLQQLNQGENSPDTQVAFVHVS